MLKKVVSILLLIRINTIIFEKFIILKPVLFFLNPLKKKTLKN